MATNSVEICNSALTLIGSRRIASLSDPSPEARNCLLNYDICRKAVLRDHPWNFATKRVDLTPGVISGAANNGAGLIRITATAHGLSTGNTITIAEVVGTQEANARWVITVINPNTFDLNGSTFLNAYVSGGIYTIAPEFGNVFKYALPTDFIRVHTIYDGSGLVMLTESYRIESGFIVTDETQLWMKYVYDLTTTTQFDPLFDEALAANIAKKICFAISSSMSQVEGLERLYDRALQKAKFTDSVEEPSSQLDADEWTRSRLGNDWVRDPRTN